MKKKTEPICFTVIFMTMILMPFIFANYNESKVSVAENRTLSPQAKLFDENGALNKNFNKDYENWINDNIGFRDFFVNMNARIKYYVFRQPAEKSNLVFGPKMALNYIGENEINDHIRNNLKNSDEIENICDGMQHAKDFVESRGIQFYYLQCWDKDSIYPEQFPNTLNQISDISMTEQVVDNLEMKTDVDIINPKNELINQKKSHMTYCTYGDPTHWSLRGSYIGYCAVMDAINKRNKGMYKRLQESDYDLTPKEMGSTISGGIHLNEMQEAFIIKNPKAYRSDSNLVLDKDSDSRNQAYSNDSVNNDTRVLILGDSYIGSFLMDDFAESFHETDLLFKPVVPDIYRLVETYQPDIVLCEAAEREDNFNAFVTAADNIKNHSYHLGDEIMFYTDDCNKYVYSGIGSAEEGYRWTDGTEMEMSMYLDDESLNKAGNQLHGRFNIAGVYHGKQSVKIIVNDNLVFEGDVTDDDKAIDFNFANPGHRKNIDIKVEIPKASSPADNNESDDARILGVQLKNFTITQ